MGERRRPERTSVVWGPAHLAGLLVLALSFLDATKVVSYLRLVLFAYFLLLCADLVLTRYHQWSFEPTAPELKRYALVTGASSGIGREMSYLLAEKRYSLVISARTEPVLKRMKAEIELVHKPVEVLVCACDLSTREGIQKLIAFVQERELVIDLLINNAGVSVTKDFLDMQPDEIEALMTLDMHAMIRLTRAIVPKMVERGIGRVLNVSSLAASFVVPTAAVYASSKAFVTSFTQALSYELRSTGVTVTCFSPGPVDTNFAQTAAIQQAVCMIIPGLTNDAKDAATRALDAMFNGEINRFDTWFSSLASSFAQSLLPPRVGAFCGAGSMHELSKLWQMLKR